MAFCQGHRPSEPPANRPEPFHVFLLLCTGFPFLPAKYHGTNQSGVTVLADILQVSNLTRRFGQRTAVDRVSFSVGEGESFGLLGPNGAGKSTTISIIAGLLKPTSGDVHVAGTSVQGRPMDTRRIIGYVPQEIALYPYLSATENLSFWGRMYGLTGSELAKRVAWALDTVGLTDRSTDRVSTFSGGMKRRLNIGAGLLHRPRLLMLDEPTVGIDPQSRNHILETVNRLIHEGMAILYTSHYMEEVEFLCHRVAIMDNGKIIAMGTTDELRLVVGDLDTLSFKVGDDAPDLESTVSSVEGVSRFAQSPGQIVVWAEHGRKVMADVITKLVDSGVSIVSVEVHEPNLETVFLHLTGKSLRD